MKFNFETNDSCLWFMDKDHMVVTHTKPWETEPDIGNRGDALINNSLCAIAYGEEDEAIFIDGILNCIDWNTQTIPFIWRHPVFRSLMEQNLPTRDETSRDQVLMMIVSLKHTKNNMLLKWVLKRLKWKLSRKFSQTPDFWIWQKSIKHNSYLLSALHNTICIPWMIWNLIQNSILYKLAGFTDKSQDEYEPTPRESLTKFQRWVAKETHHFPTYSLDKFIWQLYVMPQVPVLGWLLKRIVLGMVERSNYVQRMLLGWKVSKEDVESYRPMNGYRWSARLHEVSRQTDFIYGYSDNLIDVAMLHYIYNLTQ